MLQTQALILVSGNLYARDGITCGVGQRPGPSKQGRISGLASKSGKLLAMLHLHMLIDDFEAVGVICCLVSRGVKGMETNFWQHLPRKVRKLIIWAAVFLGKCAGFSLMGILPAGLHSFCS